MYRKIYSKLLEWKNSEVVKPLILLGARQVGKTYIIQKFCQNEFSTYKEINLLQDKQFISLYQDNTLNSDEKYNYLKTLLEFDLDKDGAILFIDEIQECEELISELKYFCEEHSNVRIICAGSLLGVKLKRTKMSFPVGKVKMLEIFPMDYEEFLMALGKIELLKEIRNCFDFNKTMNEALHNLALTYYRYYLICGGMPESVKNFISVNCDIVKYDSSIKKDIIEAYLKDMKKYVTNLNEALKIEKCITLFPNRLLMHQKNFSFLK